MNETHTEKDYSNRELDRMFKDIMDTLARIETQTTKTNGRVTKLEGREKWRDGALAVIIPAVLGILAWLGTHIGFKP